MAIVQVVIVVIVVMIVVMIIVVIVHGLTRASTHFDAGSELLNLKLCQFANRSSA